jgi:hypothetical protein
MSGVFISYRREDTAGYAGRLFDALVLRFGEPDVFMDLTDITPGSDFAEAIDRELSSCQLLLVLIGRNWLTSGDEQGHRRLQDPQDFIRREVATALARNIFVVPVLVQGARMPTAEQLPEDLKTLARRQAIELSDSRWDTDVARLETTISSKLDRTQPPTSTILQARLQRRPLALGVLIGAVVAAATVIVAFTQWASSRNDIVSKQGSAPTATDTTQTRGSSQDDPATRSTSMTKKEPPTTGLTYAVPLPAVAKVKVTGQEFEILGVRLERRTGDSDLLSFLVRMTNHSEFDDGLSDGYFRLVLAEGRKTPASGPNQLVGPLAASDGEVRFEVPKDLSKTVLEISRGDEATQIAVDLRGQKPIPQDGSVDSFGLRKKPSLVNSVARLPVALSSGAEATFDGVAYKVLSVSVDRYNVEKAAITITLRCTADKRSATVNFWDRNVRLVVDGVPRAPDEGLNELVQPGTSKDGTFAFLLGQKPDTLKLRISYSRTIEIPIDVSQIR